MAPIIEISTRGAPEPLPQFSQAVVYKDTIFCSGQIGRHPETGYLVEGDIQGRTVSHDDIHLL